MYFNKPIYLQFTADGKIDSSKEHEFNFKIFPKDFATNMTKVFDGCTNQFGKPFKKTSQNLVT